MTIVEVGGISFTTDSQGNPLPHITYPEGSEAYQPSMTIDLNTVSDARAAGGGSVWEANKT